MGLGRMRPGQSIDQSVPISCESGRHKRGQSIIIIIIIPPPLSLCNNNSNNNGRRRRRRLARPTPLGRGTSVSKQANGSQAHPKEMLPANQIDLNPIFPPYPQAERRVVIRGHTEQPAAGWSIGVSKPWPSYSAKMAGPAPDPSGAPTSRAAFLQAYPGYGYGPARGGGWRRPRPPDDDQGGGAAGMCVWMYVPVHVRL